VEPFSEAAWCQQFRRGLVAVGRVAFARDHTGPEEELKALQRVAEHPAFQGLGPSGDRLTRGKWIALRVVAAVGALQGRLPPTASTAGGEPRDKAVLLWAYALSEGLNPTELAGRFPDLLPARAGNGDRSEQALRVAAALRVRGVMWLPGNRPLRASEAGIAAVYRAVTTALQVLGDEAPTVADVSFDNDWQRLSRDRRRDELQLVTLLAFLAPQPLPLSMVQDGWEALPPPLRRRVRGRDELNALAEQLTQRGLVGSDRETVVCGQSTQERIRRRLNDRAERSAVTFVLRFLRAALPANTHFHEAWTVWRPALAHVEAAVGHSERLGVRLEDAAHLLDRLAVYHREAENDADTAITAGQRAIAVADRAGRPDPEEYAIYLGNYSMALRQARRLAEAVEVMDRSLQVTQDSLGIEHEEYAGSLSIKGNILEAWKRYTEAGEAHRQALTIIRKVMDRRPEQEVQQTLVEILNDYAAYLLRDKPGLPEDAIGQAVALLDEALTHLAQGGYGWRQVMMNRARALQSMGQLTAAEQTFRDLVAFCEQAYGDPSYELSVALRDLAEVLQELGSPEYEEVYLRAHEVDDRVGPDSSADPDDPMSAG
jgi:tetratricopeptide (TPR) repeat protein